VKKLLAFVLTFGFVCALGLSTVGCSKKEEPAKDTPAKDTPAKKDKT